MTWEPRNRCDDNDEEILTSDDEANETKPNLNEPEQGSTRNHISNTITNKDLHAIGNESDVQNGK